MTDAILVGDARWRDTSGRGENLIYGDDGGVGSLMGIAYWHGTAQSWAWAVERVNKTGWTVLESGFAASADAAKAACVPTLAGLPKGSTLFPQEEAD